MSLANDYELYKRELNLIAKQNLYEHELYSIVPCVMRERENSKEISIRDVSKDLISKIFRTDKFRSESGPPDFVILSHDYEVKDKKVRSGRILGAIEVKNIYAIIDDPRKYTWKDKKQFDDHLKYFKRVIYTNGLVWQFYESEYNGKNLGIKRKWKVTLGTYDKPNIKWESVENWNKLLKKLDETIEVMINATPQTEDKR